MMLFFWFRLSEDSAKRRGKNRLAEKKAQALLKVAAQAEQYKKEGFLPWLADAVLERKAGWIQAADTGEELAEITEPSVPRYDGGKFTGERYHVEEEELLLWSRASLAAPLNSAGYTRYMELFRKFFPEAAKEVF